MSKAVTATTARVTYDIYANSEISIRKHQLSEISIPSRRHANLTYVPFSRMIFILHLFQSAAFKHLRRFWDGEIGKEILTPLWSNLVVRQSLFCRLLGSIFLFSSTQNLHVFSKLRNSEPNAESDVSAFPTRLYLRHGYCETEHVSPPDQTGRSQGGVIDSSLRRQFI